MRTPRTLRGGAAAALLAAAGLGAAVAPAVAAPADDAGPEPKVVLFAIDGFDADYLDGRAPLPNIEQLARRGALTTSTGACPR